MSRAHNNNNLDMGTWTTIMLKWKISWWDLVCQARIFVEVHWSELFTIKMCIKTLKKRWTLVQYLFFIDRKYISVQFSVHIKEKKTSNVTKNNLHSRSRRITSHVYFHGGPVYKLPLWLRLLIASLWLLLLVRRTTEDPQYFQTEFKMFNKP